MARLTHDLTNVYTYVHRYLNYDQTMIKYDRIRTEVESCNGELDDTYCTAMLWKLF